MTLELTERILKHIESTENVDTFDLVGVFNEDHQKIVGALKSIEAHGNLLNSETTTHKSWELTEEGKYVVENGSHEAAVFKAVPVSGGIAQADLMKVRRPPFWFESTHSSADAITRNTLSDLSLRQGGVQQSDVTGLDSVGQEWRGARD